MRVSIGMCSQLYSKGAAIDRYKMKIGLFPHVRGIMSELERCGIAMAACSR